MTFYKAHARFFPIPVNVNPVEFKTTIFEGTSAGTSSLQDAYHYFGSNPLIEVMNYQMVSWLWGDPMAFPTVGYTQIGNTWGTTAIPNIRMKWDIHTCNADGGNSMFIGEVITPLRDIGAYNTR